MMAGNGKMRERVKRDAGCDEFMLKREKPYFFSNSMHPMARSLIVIPAFSEVEAASSMQVFKFNAATPGANDSVARTTKTTSSHRAAFDALV